MSTFPQFLPPGHVHVTDALGRTNGDLASLWHEHLKSMLSRAGVTAPLYDPTVDDTPPGASFMPIGWRAFPATLNHNVTSASQRNSIADSARVDRQDEYCEWSVQREESGAIRRVTFTTEVPEYYEFLGQHDPDALLALYQQHVSPTVTLTDIAPDGTYDPLNTWNTRTDGPIMHLVQENNTLSAAITLVVAAIAQRHDGGGNPVTSQHELVRCAGLGAPLRNSDPKIATTINGLAGAGMALSLADPIGLHISRFDAQGIVFPPGAELGNCWHLDRGRGEKTVRARFEVPSEFGTVSDVTINGASIEHGAQLADRVEIGITAIAHSPGTHSPPLQPCQPLPGSA